MFSIERMVIAFGMLADEWRACIEELSEDCRMIANEYHPGVIIGAAVGILVFIVEVVLCTKKIIFSGEEKKLAAAKANGHVLLGKRIDCYYEDRDSNVGRNVSERYYYATYEYTVNGVKKRKNVYAREFEPPYELEIYYVKTPRKVFTEYDLKGNPLQILIYIIPLVVGAWVARMLGA